MTDTIITKSIKQLATELYYAAKAEGHDIKTITFDESVLLSLENPFVLKVTIESELCDKKAP